MMFLLSFRPLMAFFLLFAVALIVNSTDLENPTVPARLANNARVYSLQSYQVSKLWQPAYALGFYKPIYKIFPGDNDQLALKVVFDNKKMGFNLAEFLNKKEMLAFLAKNGKLNVVLAKDGIVFGQQVKHQELSALATDPIFVGQMSIENRDVIHLYDLPEHTYNREYLVRALKFIIDFFPNSIRLIHHKDQTIQEFDICEYYEDTYE